MDNKKTMSHETKAIEKEEQKAFVRTDGKKKKMEAEGIKI